LINNIAILTFELAPQLTYKNKNEMVKKKSEKEFILGRNRKIHSRYKDIQNK